jgi:hypothetical protein
MSGLDPLEAAAGNTPLEHALVIGAELMRRHAEDVRDLTPGWGAQLTDLADLLDHTLAVLRGCRELGNAVGVKPDGQMYLVDVEEPEP